MTPLRFIGALAGTAVGLGVMAYASAVPLSFHRSDAAMLRLSWSARPERIETCRAVSAEEQEKREEHMRQRVECEGVFATYLLRVELDGRAIGESIIHGAGLRHDRPLYLLKSFPVRPGEHRVRIALTRREKHDRDTSAVAATVAEKGDTGVFAGRAERETTERQRRTQAAIPPILVFDTTLVFSPRRVELVTFDPERKTLQLHREGRRP